MLHKKWARHVHGISLYFCLERKKAKRGTHHVILSSEKQGKDFTLGLHCRVVPEDLGAVTHDLQGCSLQREIFTELTKGVWEASENGSGASFTFG